MRYDDIKDTRGNYFVTFKYQYLTRFTRICGATPQQIKKALTARYPGASNFRFKKSLIG